MKTGKLSLLPFLKRSALAVLLVSSAMTQTPTTVDAPIAAPADLSPGVVVEKVAADSLAEKAALQPGDVLLRWTRGDARGAIESPFDISLIEIEQWPRGTVQFEGLRGNEKREWNFVPGDWGLKTRPNFQGNLLSLYREGQQFAEAGKPAEAAERWRAAAGQADQPAPAWLRPWLLSHIADTFAEALQWKEADATYQESAGQPADMSSTIKGELLQRWAKTFGERGDWVNAEKQYRAAAAESQSSTAESLFLADCFERIAYSLWRRGDLVQAEKYDSEALAIQQKLAPASLLVAKTLDGLGLVARDRGDLTKAEEYFSKALEMSQKLAPGSMIVAQTFNYLGLAARRRGDLARAGKYLDQAWNIYEKISPEDLDAATVLRNFGLVAMDRGDLGQADGYYMRALQIQERFAPGSLELAGTLNDLGVEAMLRGDVVKGDDYFNRALKIQEILAPESIELARSLMNVGAVAYKRGDLARAEDYNNRSLAIEKKVAPGSLDEGNTIHNLGIIVRDQGDFAKAEKYLNQALTVAQSQARGSLVVANRLTGLGELYSDDGPKAEKYFSEALAIRKKLAPGSRDVAESLTDLGDIARSAGDLEKAEEYYSQARDIWGKLFQGSKEYAEVLADLAGIMLQRGQLDAAAPLFEQALNALESHTAHLGGSQDVRSNFRAKYLSYYKNYMDLLIRQKQPELAFQVLERSRARTLIEMLNEAHIDVHKGVDSALLERKRSLAGDLSAKYNRRLRLLSKPDTGQQVDAVNQEIEKLLAQHKDVDEQIIASSPGYAALTQPRPLGVKAIQQLLDQDTLLLEYSLGTERSYLFALTSDSLDVFPLPKGAEIEAVARRARQELSVNNPAASYESTMALSSMLLGPVIELMDRKRLAIVADGMLQYIPFEALRTAPGELLIAPHEIVYLPSASTLAVLRKQTEGRAPAPRQVAVFADPVFDASDARLKAAVAGDARNGNSSKKVLSQDDPAAALADSANSDVLTRSAADLGMMAKGAVYLPRLLSSRQEATSILSVAQAGQTMAALDFDASRATATSPASAQYRIVHFATHGLVNNKHPELSGLVLSMVDENGKQQNGFLGLQDIYNLNLPADLVVLSACETGLGREIQGEGLVGLARAFMYAGSPRVVATLWQVPDRATAELMKRFYRAMLVDHLPPAAALRQAQISLSKEKHWSAPYYWAGFVLQGEWK
jgi:CHAT domain-containing protein/Tfp pilus assembly protein PilF